MLDSVVIFGTKEKGKRRVEEYVLAEVDLPILIFPPKPSRDVVRETIIGLAP